MVYLRAKAFKRKKDAKPKIYYYLVEARREKGKVQQKVIRYLGTAERINNYYKELSDLRAKHSPKP
ncbi:MAG: hypothetical protein QME12_08330 [Nanoarchaeota archaeon]|nr:hypothetical protein [Nanoarchaeota archaeon]